jgi:DNA polymerase-4
LRTAARLCPEAVFLPSDPPAYDEVSARVMDALRTLPGLVVEVLGWDEAFLGAHTSDPETLAAVVRHTVKEETGLSCAVGIGDTRLRAKIATGFAKPAGIFRLSRHNWVEVMADRPPEALWGIGQKTARKLAAMGINTVAELGRADPAVLARRFGPTMGPYYRVLAYGGGDAKVSAEPYLPRSRSRETTFQRNVDDRAELDDHLVALARRVAKDVDDEGRLVVQMAVKVRFAPFFTQTRSVSLRSPTRDPDTLEKAATEALARFDLTRPIRLLGVRADFEPLP